MDIQYFKKLDLKLVQALKIMPLNPLIFVINPNI